MQRQSYREGSSWHSIAHRPAPAFAAAVGLALCLLPGGRLFAGREGHLDKASVPKTATTVRHLTWLNAGTKLLAEVASKQQGVDAGSALYILDVMQGSAERVPLSKGSATQASACGGPGDFVFVQVASGSSEFPEASDIGYRGSDGKLGRMGLTGLNEFPVCAAHDSRIAFSHVHATQSTGSTADTLDTGLWVGKTDGTGLVQATRPGAGVPNGVQYDGPPAIAADGRQIAFVRRQFRAGTGSAGPEGSADLWVVSSDGTALRRVTSLGDIAYRPLVWYPSGRALAFLREERTTTKAHGGRALSVWRAATSGGQPTRLLTPSDLAWPDSRDDIAISPDGTKVAVITHANARPGTLRLVDVDRHTSRLLAQGALSAPAWSSDGTRLAFCKDGREVWTVRPGDSGVPSRVWRLSATAR